MEDRPGTAAIHPTALSRPGRRRLRLLLRGIALAVLAAAGWVGVRVRAGNLGVVQEGRVYRSAQLGGDALGRVIDRYKVKTVLNLRGPNPQASWYRDERAAVRAKGATRIDVPLSSCEWMSRAQAAKLLEVLETAERPLLIHCQWGSERTGMASAFLELLRPGATLADAERQFSLHYLYVPFGNGVVTEQHLKQYESWLDERGLAHSPVRFRNWVAEGYRPGRPSREFWPRDPYPLAVVEPPTRSR